MKKTKFAFPMTKAELIAGSLFIPIFILLLPELVRIVAGAASVNLSDQKLSVVFYLVSFVIVFIIFRSYLKRSFSDLVDGRFATIGTIIICFVLYYILLYALSFVLLLLDVGVNPNNEAVAAVQLNPNNLIAVSVLLAPIVEETLFRGLVFGSIRRKSRIAAYIVSFLVFSLYHLWPYFLHGFVLSDLLLLVDYLPASIVLAMAYERSGSVWSSILLHMLINILSISVALAL